MTPQRNSGRLRKPTRRWPTLLVLTLALHGCKTAPPSEPHAPPDDGKGAVSYQLIPAISAGQLQLERGQHAFGAQPVAHDAPTYPEALISKKLPPESISVKAIVGEDGRVTEVRDLHASTEVVHKAFFAACQQAVMQWKYSPMTVVQDVDDGKGNITQVEKNAAFSLDYAFQFEIVDGQPKVTGGQ